MATNRRNPQRYLPGTDNVPRAEPKHRALSACLVSVLCAAACEEDPGLPLQFESKYVSYYAVDDRPDPPELSQWFDNEYEAVTRWLGPDFKVQPHIDYFNFDGSDRGQWLAATCGTAANCTIGTSVYVGAALHTHELAHAIVSRRSRPPRLLAEGFAELVAGDGWSIALPWPADFEHWFENKTFRTYQTKQPRRTYVIAQMFSESLVAHFGASAYIRFYQTVNAGDLNATIAEKFEQIFGTTLVDFMETVRGEAPPWPADRRVPLRERYDPYAAVGTWFDVVPRRPYQSSYQPECFDACTMSRVSHPARVFVPTASVLQLSSRLVDDMHLYTSVTGIDQPSPSGRELGLLTPRRLGFGDGKLAKQAHVIEWTRSGEYAVEFVTEGFIYGVEAKIEFVDDPFTTPCGIPPTPLHLVENQPYQVRGRCRNRTGKDGSCWPKMLAIHADSDGMLVAGSNYAVESQRDDKMYRAKVPLTPKLYICDDLCPADPAVDCEPLRPRPADATVHISAGQTRWIWMTGEFTAPEREPEDILIPFYGELFSLDLGVRTNIAE